MAGLALGLALRRRDVPATIVEASTYPRHRVCGEFISGIERGELAELGVEELFDAARRHTSTAWFEDGRAWFRGVLPAPAYGLSRHRLDGELARRFAGCGGELREGARHETNGEGVVWASGRPRAGGGWLGLKAHFEDLELSADLELHMQDRGYVGLTRVEDGRVNVCGLFRAVKSSGELASACEAAGMNSLAVRLRAARLVAGSNKGVSNFQLGWQPAVRDRICIGDAAAMIPPFTGNGMAMALQSGIAAADDLAAWSEGRIGWAEASERVRQRHQRRFSRRLRWALALQALVASKLNVLVAGIAC